MTTDASREMYYRNLGFKDGVLWTEGLATIREQTELLRMHIDVGRHLVEEGIEGELAEDSLLQARLGYGKAKVFENEYACEEKRDEADSAFDEYLKTHLDFCQQFLKTYSYYQNKNG